MTEYKINACSRYSHLIDITPQEASSYSRRTSELNTQCKIPKIALKVLVKQSHWRFIIPPPRHT
jgi:hypothetical protein